jgi:P-loop containing NTP hydrolase pore-1/C-terminal domain on Strawberry notch homologue/Large polyvalent protein-associated domain 1
MASVADLKQKFPELADASDDEVVDVMQRNFYPDASREQLAKELGVKLAPAPEPKKEPSGKLRRAADVGLSVAQGVVQVPQAALGLADLVTGGHLGKTLENEGGAVGYRPNEAVDFLQGLKSPESQAGAKEIQQAGTAQPGEEGVSGFASQVGRVAGAAVRNPMQIVESVGQSIPSMLAGGVVGRGAAALAPRIGAVGAGALGEGVVAAGSGAEQVRTDESNKSGLLTPTQAALAAGSGALTGVIGRVSGKLAQRLGLEDIDTVIAAGKGTASSKETSSVVMKVLKGAVTEGGLEELPQSVQEQVAQNIALGKPLDTGVAHGAVMGALAGGVMGAGAQAFHGKSAGDVMREEKQPVVGAGVLTSAVNAGIEDAAEKADDAVPPHSPAPPTPPREANAQIIEAIRAIPSEFQDDALNAYNLGNRMDVAPGVRRWAQNRFDQLVGPQLALQQEKEQEAATGAANADQAAADRALDTEAKQDHKATLDEETARAEMIRKNAEIEAEQASMSAEEAAAQREKTRPAEPKLDTPQEGDILNPRGEPFLSKFAAQRALSKAGADTHEIIPVADGGMVVRKRKESDLGKDSGVAGASGETASADGNGSAGDVGTHAPDGSGSGGGLAQAAGVGDGQAGPVVGGSGRAGAVVGPAPVAVQPKGTRGTSAADVLPAGGAAASVPAAVDAPVPSPTSAEAKTTGAPIGAQPAGTRSTSIDDLLAPIRAEEARLSASGEDAKRLQILRRLITEATNHLGATVGEAPIDVQPTGTRGTNADDVVVKPAVAEKTPEVEMAQTPAPTSAERTTTGEPILVQPKGTRGTSAEDVLTPAEQKVADEVAAASTDPYDITTHVTQRGKTLRGTVREDLTPVEAKALDPFTFKKDGGWYIREEHFGKLTEFLAQPKAEPKQPEPPVAEPKEPPSGGGTIAEPKPEPKPKEPPKPKALMPVGTKVKVLIDDPSGRFMAGADGVTVENDFPEKYAYKVDLGPDPMQQPAEPSGSFLDGLTMKRVFYFQAKEIERAPKPPKPPPVQDQITAMFDSSDANGLAELVYERDVFVEDLPQLFVSDRLARFPVLLAEQKDVEAKLKKLGFRISDRAQESAQDGRMMISALYKPKTGGIEDVGEQLEGGRKEGPKPPPPVNADEDEIEAFVETIRPALFMDADLPGEQRFGTMMFKEAIIGHVKSPLIYLSEIANSHVRSYDRLSPTKLMVRAFKDATARAAIVKASEDYVATLKKLQDIFSKHTIVDDLALELRATYGDRYDLTAAGRELNPKMRERIGALVDTWQKKFTNDTSTDQSERYVKKDPDQPPALERIVRIGMKDHRGGKDVTTETLQSTFGFKGIEYGNWVNQPERQSHLNMVYDSLMDLVDLTGLDPKVVGMNGELGFAIGARGRGAKAAAHFEPSNNVINLTKTMGHGTVAHEWFHALDHNSGALQEGENNGMARHAVESLAETLQQAYSAEKARDYVLGELRNASSSKNRNMPPKMAALEAIFGREGRRSASYYSEPEVFSNAQRTTSFFANASQMDRDSSGARYWSTPVELLARGFETMIYDDASGGSPYLVGPSRGDGVMTKKNGYKGTAYATGEERQYIADQYRAHFANFDATYKLKPYDPQFTITEVPDVGFVALDQHGVGAESGAHYGPQGKMRAYKTAAEAEKWASQNSALRVLDAKAKQIGEMNRALLDTAVRLDAIMEEMGILRWPELKNGSMAESMFYHLRQGWYPKDNNDLKDFAAKAFKIERNQVGLLQNKQAQEDFEAALGRYAQQRIIDMRRGGADDRGIYDYLVGLYNTHAVLDVRTGISTANQAYSTPLPIGFTAGILGRVGLDDKVLDPTGGNGMLVINANPKLVTAVELDPNRANNMRLMEIGKVIEGDALAEVPKLPDQAVDVVLANPPFGALAKNVEVKSWDGDTYALSKIDHVIAAQALHAMADRGRAVLILGAAKAEGVLTSSDRVFLNWLYTNYNVADHFEIDGSLYHRMGASWPLRYLVIAGRKQTTGAYPRETVIDRVGTHDQLWERVNEARERSESIVVGAGAAQQGAGSPSGQPGGLPGRAGGKAGGSDRGQGGAGGKDTGVAGGGTAPGGIGEPGGTGGNGAGNDGLGGAGQGGVAGNGATGKSGGGRGRSGGAGRTDVGGLSGLTDDSLDGILDDVFGSAKKRPAGVRGPSTGGGGTSGTPRTPRAPKGPQERGPSVFDNIPGLGDLLGQLGKELGVGEDPEPTPPTPPKGVRRSSSADAPRESKAKTAIRRAVENTSPNLPTGEASHATLLRSMQDALSLDDAASLAAMGGIGPEPMFSRKAPVGQDEQQYSRVAPILSRIWDALTDTIGDVAERIRTFATGALQSFGDLIRPHVKRFLQELRSEQSRVPSHKKPVSAEAIDTPAQVVYRGRSRGNSGGIFVPRNQSAALERAFDAFEAEYGEVDDFVRNELGYETEEEMHKGLGGYQIDALALSIAAMRGGNGFIIGDDTGVGKGRTAAALISWAVKQGKIPVFVSYKSDLYTSMYGDMSDIGRADTKILMTNSDSIIKDPYDPSPNSKALYENTPEQSKADIQHIIATGTLPRDAQAIFTAYSQLNVENDRQKAIARLVRDGKAVLIMDESHNSAGDGEGNTNAFFMKLLTGSNLFGESEEGVPPPEDWKPPPTTYLSATYAKRPDNMPVYVRTHLRHAANSPGELADMFKSGGAVMQQIASTMLVEAGSMIRRERSYAGVNFDFFTDEANAARDAREVDEVTKCLRQIVYADRAFAAWVEDTSEGGGAAVVHALAPPGFEASFAGQAADVSMNKSLFTSVVHNYVGQLLLSSKVQTAVEKTVEALNRGEKPVMTLQNTLEAALRDYTEKAGLKPGDKLENFGWQSMLTRGLTSARRVTFKKGKGKKVKESDRARIIVPMEVLPEPIKDEFRRAEKLIANFQSDLPGSPLDALRQRLSKYWIVETKDAQGNITRKVTKEQTPGSRPLAVAEITGRELAVDYSTTPPTLVKRQDPGNLDIIKGFQNGGLDAVIINSSGSTGISLHASERAVDQSVRHMIVLQPNPDISVMKQTTGRIHRTGQVEWPKFTFLATGIPAERRQNAVLKKKIGLLFSNTSAGDGTMDVKAVDFINKYGDVIVAEYLDENPEVAAFVGIKNIKDAKEAPEDTALTASGRAALLPVSQQEEFFDTVEQNFLAEIEMRNAAGTNELERRSEDLQAVVKDALVLEEGMDETNPFTASAYMGTMEVNVIGDVPSPEKVKESISTALNGRTASQVVEALAKTLETSYDEAVNQLVLRKTMVETQLNDVEITPTEKTSLEERKKAIEDTISKQAERREKTLRSLRTSYAIGTGGEIKVGDVESSYVIVGMSAKPKKSGNPFAPSNVMLFVERNLPGGRLNVPLSKIEGDVVTMTPKNWGFNIDEEFAMRSVVGGRVMRQIAYGNLLRARVAVKGMGEILIHTMQGSTPESSKEQGGIRMPSNFVLGNNAKTDFTIRYPEAAIDYLLELAGALQEHYGSQYSDEQATNNAVALRGAAKYRVPIDYGLAKEITDSGAWLRGPDGGWSLSNRYGGNKATIRVGTAYGKIVKNKELIAAMGQPLAKKRGDSYYTGNLPMTISALKTFVRVVAANSALTVPEQAKDVARELAKMHFKGESNREDTSFARDAIKNRPGLDMGVVSGTVASLSAGWKNAPEIVTASSMDDPVVPQAVRDQDAKMRAAGATGDPRAVVSGGKVYLFANAFRTREDVAEAAFHEVLGHIGLHGAFGKEMGAHLDKLALTNRAQVRKKATEYGLDFETQKGRRQAAEEVLAEMAQTRPEIGWVRTAIAIIRTWLREHMPGYKSLKMSDAEIIRNYLIPARQFVAGVGAENPVTYPGDPPANDPMFSRSLGGAVAGAMNNLRDVALPAGYKVADFMASNADTGRLSWWHKTVGTPFNLAQRNPHFKRVFDSVQSFLSDASYFTNEAANKAPTILPRLEKMTDIWKTKPLSAADTKALSAPVFEGTLNWTRNEKGEPVKIEQAIADAEALSDEKKAQRLFREGKVSEAELKRWQASNLDIYSGAVNNRYEREYLQAGVVWTEPELKSRFGLDDRQVGLYNEFRAAITTSLGNLAISNMIRLAGEDGAAIKDQMTGMTSFDDAAVLMRDHLYAQAAENPARADVLNDTGNRMIDIADTTKRLVQRGYAPLSRFGQHTVYATSPTGEQLYFEMFESSAEAARRVRELRADPEFADASIVQGTTNEEAYKMFAGITPETAEIFGQYLGLEAQGSEAKDIAFQEFLKLAKSSRSAMKRMIHRKGIAGFSQDASRVLAGFVYSNGRQTATNLHQKEMTQAALDVPKQQGEVASMASKLVDYVRNPQEEAQAIRGLLFAQYLGGNVASAMVNATQPLTVTLPWLTQFGGAKKAARRMAAALKFAGQGKDTGDPDLNEALRVASEQGIVSPQEVHQLLAQGAGKAALKVGDGTLIGNTTAGAMNYAKRLTLSWGKVFGFAEQFNRRLTFIAAYNTAKEEGMDDPAAFAARAVAETQFTYNKGNKPAWARGWAGSILFTFKQYVVNYLEMLHRMATAGEPGSPERAAGRKAALLAIAALMLVGGADGLPFEADIEDLLDGFMQRLGYNFSSKRKKRAFLADLLGEGGADIVLKGFSGVPGVPIDVSGRMGLGNVIPGTGLAQKKDDHSRDYLELAGPVGDLAKRGTTALGQLVDRDVYGALRSISPTAARNVEKGIDMANTGMYRDDKGRKVIDSEGYEAAMKALGFQPRTVAKVQEATGEVQQEVAMVKLKQAEIADEMAKAMFDKDQEKIAALRADIQQWNKDNPESPLRINMPGVLKRLSAMKESKAQRIAKTAPAAMRARVRSELAAQ